MMKNKRRCYTKESYLTKSSQSSFDLDVKIRGRWLSLILILFILPLISAYVLNFSVYNKTDNLYTLSKYLFTGGK